LRFRPTKAIIRLDYLKENFRTLKAINKNSFICPMVKANAYGHGGVEVAKALIDGGAQYLGVALVEEAVILRDHQIKTEILVFGGFDDSAIAELSKNNLTPVVGILENLKMFAQANANMKIHLKIDTGMHRLGILPDETAEALEIIKRSPHLKLAGLATHLVSGNDVEASDFQLRIFSEAVKKFEALETFNHVFNSMGLLRSAGNYARFGARPGILLYGASPGLSEAEQSRFKQVMTLKTTVVRYHHLQKGHSVSYGSTWTADKESVIAVLPIGYADGVKRSLSNRGEVLFRNKRAKIDFNPPHRMPDLTGDSREVNGYNVKSKSSACGAEMWS
jgi:alanine racemase